MNETSLYGKHILVTGGAGYVGSHACKALNYLDYITVTFDNISSGWKSAVKSGRFEHGDLRSEADFLKEQSGENRL